MQKLSKLYKTSRVVILLTFIIDIAIAYGFASLSIDRGNLWWYLLAIIFLVRALKDLIRLVGSFMPNGREAA